MNLTKLIYRVPERVRIGVGGIVLAMLFVAGPNLAARWVSLWL